MHPPSLSDQLFSFSLNDDSSTTEADDFNKILILNLNIRDQLGQEANSKQTLRTDLGILTSPS